MSLRVHVITEDHKFDGAIAKAVVSQALSKIGVSKSIVSIERARDATGWDAVSSPSRVAQWIEENSLVHLFLLVCDRDGNEGRPNKFVDLSRDDQVDKALGKRKQLVGILAIEEMEVWLLAAQPNTKQWRWKPAFRWERDLKENSFQAFVKRRKLDVYPGNGRSYLAGQITSEDYTKRIRMRCPEIEQFEKELAKAVIAIRNEDANKS